MTQNQLKYLQYEEDIRANRAKENIDTLNAVANASKARSAEREVSLKEAQEYNRPIEIGFGPFKIKSESKGSREKLEENSFMGKNDSLFSYVNGALNGGFKYA